MFNKLALQLLIAIHFSATVFAAVAIDKPASFGPLPGHTLDYKSTTPLSIRVEQDLANLEEFRQQRVAILEARLELLRRSVPALREIARHQPSAGSSTARLYEETADHLERDVFPAHPLHELISSHADPNSRYTQILRHFLLQAKHFEATPLGAPWTELLDIRRSLFELELLFSAQFEKPATYAAEPFSLFAEAEPISLTATLPLATQEAFGDCRFFPNAVVRRSSQVQNTFGSTPIFALIEDAPLIARILDGVPSQGIPPLSVRCGFRFFERKFKYDVSENRMYNHRSLQVSSPRGEGLKGIFWTMPAVLFEDYDLWQAMRIALKIQ